jgi:Cof subfamily protein (haloacid dehalogenase superfamily)
MIKLVASDMDGTLLDQDSRVPPETYDLIRALGRHGVHFCASSGRRYDTLCEFFAPVRDQMDFVASNGTQVYVDGRMVDREVYSTAALRQLQRSVGMFDCLHLAVFDKRVSYLLDEMASYERELDKDLPNAERASYVPGPEVSVIKASIYCDRDDVVMDMAYALQREMGSAFTFAPSGKRWIDVIPRGVSKATGLRQVMLAHGIEPSEVMAFGDAMNDYEILRMVGHSRAMGNGRYAIRQVADKVIGTNAEHSVQAEMRQLLEQLG